MALSTRELYLILRAKNEATGALRSLGRDLDSARRAAELMGVEAQKAHLQAEQSAARHSKALAEYNLRQLESQRAAAQEAVATEQATQKMLAYNVATLEGQRSAQQHTMAITQQRQAMDQNAVALLQNAKAHNDVQIAQLRGVQGSQQQIQALNAQNLVLRDQVATVRDGIIARQNEINSQRESINSTQQQINVLKEHQQVAKQNLLVAQDSARSYAGQVNAQRDVVAGMRLDIAERQNQINAVNREIDAINKSNDARDRANLKLRDTGQAMATAGTAMAAGGAIAIAGMFQLTQSAADYEKQTAMTKTQVRDTGVTLQQLGDIGLQVARDFGVPFDTIQKGFFDIFSSTDATVGQATVLLRDFAKAAVAGGVDIEKAGTTTIGVLNAWHRPLEDTTKILDTQFKVVQLGRVNYDQLSSTIGRSIPSAVRAGQSFETLGGMIAYMTRSGASAAQATTSAGRALDLFANSKVVGRLKEMGINARDASGNFRPLSDVVLELQDHMAKLDPVKRAEEIDALFKGSGNNIQARRFWDLVLASDKGAESFKKMVEDVTNSGGSLEEAYGTMSDTMSVRNEKMINQWKAMGIEAGTALFPAMEQISNKLSELAEAFNNLTPGQQSFLAWAVVVGAALTVVAGVVFIFAGALTMLAGVIGIGAGLLGLIVIAVGAFAAAWIYAYTQVQWFHDAVNWWFQHLWEVIKWFVGGWAGALAQLWQALVNTGNSLAETFGTIRDVISAFLNWFVTGWQANLDRVKEQVKGFLDWFVTGWTENLQRAKDQILGFINWFTEGWSRQFADAKNAPQDFWNWFSNGWVANLSAVRNQLQAFWSWFTGGWAANFNAAKAQGQAFWSWFTGGWTSTLASARSAISSFFSWFTSGWASTFASARSAIQSFFSWFTSGWSSTLASARSALSSFWSWFTSGWSSTLSAARSAVSSGMNAILSVINSIISAIRGVFQGLIGQGYSIGANIVNGIRDGVIGAAGALASAAASVVTNALAAARAAIGINSPSKTFADKVGGPISEGMAKGVMDNARMLNSAVSVVTRGAVNSAAGGMASAGRLLSMAQSQSFGNLTQTLGSQRSGSNMGSPGLEPVGGFSGNRGSGGITLNVYTQEIDPRRNAMMLGMELEKAIV